MQLDATVNERLPETRAARRRPTFARGLTRAYRVLLGTHRGETESARAMLARETDGKTPREARDHASPGTCTLKDLGIGEEAEVLRLLGCRIVRLKLSSLGVVPGAGVVLEQRRPGLVFRMGRSRFAVDEDLGSSIEVRRRPRV